MKQTLGQLIRQRQANVPFADMLPEQRISMSELVHSTDGGWDGSIMLSDYAFTTSSQYPEQRTYAVKDSAEHERLVTTSAPRRVLALRFRRIADGTVEPTEHYALTTSSVLIRLTEQSFSHDDLPLPTRIAERRSHRGRVYLVFE